MSFSVSWRGGLRPRGQPSQVKVVVVGGGAREHVLATVLGRNADEVVVTPGNAGIPGSVATSPLELEADLFVIGPEAPLVEGLADRLRAQKKRVFGPGADGARLEGSKAWMKDVVAEAGVPTARYDAFSELEPALVFLKTMAPPYVVKTDGLAAGKGVLVTESLAEAEDDVRAKLAGETFAGAGRTVVIEEGMTGPELSVLAICDGENALLLPAAQDFKRERDNDEGPNTGGMGAYSPVPGVDVDALDVQGRFIEPTLNALRKRDIDYRGVLYAGLMLTSEGPKLVEFNVRFGDPESECVLPLVTGDLTEVLAWAADGRVPARIAVAAGAAVTVMASGTEAGAAISGMDDAAAIDGVSVVHARTALDGNGRFVTAGGGRILGVTGEAATLREARERAYAGMARIAFEGMHYRNDIAEKASEPEAETEGERETQCQE